MNKPVVCPICQEADGQPTRLRELIGPCDECLDRASSEQMAAMGAAAQRQVIKSFCAMLRDRRPDWRFRHGRIRIPKMWR